MDTILKKILYVEDEPDIQAIAQIALEDIGGFTVKICSTGYEALDCALEFKPDLLLLDVMLPGLDGTETLKKLREQPLMKTVPVIFLTARMQEKELADYKKLGIIDVITKPFDPLTLSSSILQLWKNY